METETFSAGGSREQKKNQTCLLAHKADNFGGDLFFFLKRYFKLLLKPLTKSKESFTTVLRSYIRPLKDARTMFFMRTQFFPVGQPLLKCPPHVFLLVSTIGLLAV